MTDPFPPPARRLFLALGCVGFLSSPALAATDATPTRATSSTASRTSSSPASDRRASSNRPRRPAPLLDTPQTVTVISDQTLRRQNLLTLRDALATIPGITFGAGEGGGGYGDSINLRGYRRTTTSPSTASATAPSTAAPTRSTCSRSKSTTAPIRCSTARAASAARSTSSPRCRRPRTSPSSRPRSAPTIIIARTVDINQRVSDLIAVRLNAMFHRNDVPGPRLRGLPALGRRAGDHLRHRRADQPDARLCPPATTTTRRSTASPISSTSSTTGRCPRPTTATISAIATSTSRRSTVDRLTATFRHEFSDDISIRNLTRWQRVDQYSQTSAPQGTFCLAGTGRQPVSAGPNDATACPARRRRQCRDRQRSASAPSPSRSARLLAAVRPARPGPRPAEPAAPQPDRPARRQRRERAACATRWWSAAR